MASRHATLACALGIMLLACAAPPKPPQQLVVVLPDESGMVGGVEVDDGESVELLESAFAGARAPVGGRSERVTVTDQEVRESFGAALAALPIPPRRFRLYFLRDSDELTEESKRDFEEVFADIARRKIYEVEVVGHTDRLADEDYNAALSLERANAVRDNLVARGVGAPAIRVYGRGENDPLVPTEDGVEQPLNRRVEITVR